MVLFLYVSYLAINHIIDRVHQIGLINILPGSIQKLLMERSVYDLLTDFHVFLIEHDFFRMWVIFWKPIFFETKPE